MQKCIHVLYGECECEYEYTAACILFSNANNRQLDLLSKEKERDRVENLYVYLRVQLSVRFYKINDGDKTFISFYFK